MTAKFLTLKNKKYTQSATITLLIFLALLFTGITGCSNDKTISDLSGKVEANSIKEKAAVSPSATITQSPNGEQTPQLTKGMSVTGQIKIHFIDVGQADCILVQQNGQNMLIDAGNNADFQTIKSYLDGQGVKELQYFIGTHAHEDHIGAADYIINAFKVGKVYFPRQTAATQTFKDFVSAVKNKGLSLTAPNVGDTFKLGDATCTILAPNSPTYEDANDYSIVIKVQYGDNKFLLTGDAESISEMEMVKKGLDLKADVLKVGHHASKTSTAANFLKAVSPKYAVVSVGKGNSYGHPAQGTMDRLKNAGVTVYRTDENGTIVMTSNGKEIEFSTQPGSYNGVSSSYASTSGTVVSSNTTANQSGAVVNPAPTQQPAQNDNQNIIVYRTNTGTKYHTDGCRYLSKSRIDVSLGDAKAMGLGPCSVCHPPQ